VIYFNLVGTPAARATAMMDEFIAARAIVFDVRGYPDSGFLALLPYLSSRTLYSAWWKVPVITRPDRQEVRYDTSRWTLAPQAPTINAKLVFITDGSAISYAESCLGIIEQFKLGRIVGEPTAGANGNVISVTLPGGHMVQYTGMRVIKNNDAPHHAVGIIPTDPVQRTIKGVAAGQDELLDRAIEVASELIKPAP
jgi:C-terminal processing protease CtpA/Prc